MRLHLPFALLSLLYTTSTVLAGTYTPPASTLTTVPAPTPTNGSSIPSIDKNKDKDKDTDYDYDYDDEDEYDYEDNDDEDFDFVDDDENGDLDDDDDGYFFPPADQPCDCYVVSGPEPGYFQHHRFYDFRQSNYHERALNKTPPGPSGSPGRPVNASRVKGTADKSNRAGMAYHDSLDGTAFAKDWNVQSWDRQGSVLFPVNIANSIDNIFMVKNSTDEDDSATHLVLRTTRFENYTSTAEVEYGYDDLLHCSLRARLRLYSNEGWVSSPFESNSTVNASSCTVPGDAVFASYNTGPPEPGVCAGIFTYHSRDVESDIEILTSDPETWIRYSNQPDWDPITDLDIPGASSIVDLPVSYSTWANHRIDWFPGMSRWFLDDDLQLEKTYGVPDKPSMVVLNLWSDGGVWSGNLSVGSSVFMGVEWIEVLYNTSASNYPNFDKITRSSRRRNSDDDDDEDEPDYDDDEAEDNPEEGVEDTIDDIADDNVEEEDGYEEDEYDDEFQSDGLIGRRRINRQPVSKRRRHQKILGISKPYDEQGDDKEQEEYNNLESKKIEKRRTRKEGHTIKPKKHKGKGKVQEDKECRVICRVDDVRDIGVPEVVQE